MISTTALALLREKPLNKLSFGCQMIDNHIGGIPMRGITEIGGEAGAGKTQLCLILALQAILDSNNNGLNGSVAYLSCGEGNFPIKRLSQIAQHCMSPYLTPPPDSSQPESKLKDMLSRIHIEQCMNPEEATETIFKRLPELCRNKDIKLLIIDSLAGMIRFEYNTQKENEMRERTSHIFSLAKQLKWLSDTFNIGIVVVNQVTAGDFDSLDLHKGNVRFNKNKSSNIPALGLAWSTCITTRIFITKVRTFMVNNVYDDDGIDREYYNELGNSSVSSIKENGNRQLAPNCNHHLDDQGLAVTQPLPSASVIYQSKREIKLVFSPLYPSQACHFEIYAGGVRCVV